MLPCLGVDLPCMHSPPPFMCVYVCVRYRKTITIRILDREEYNKQSSFYVLLQSPEWRRSGKEQTGVRANHLESRINRPFPEFKLNSQTFILVHLFPCLTCQIPTFLSKPICIPFRCIRYHVASGKDVQGLNVAALLDHKHELMTLCSKHSKVRKQRGRCSLWLRERSEYKPVKQQFASCLKPSSSLTQ